MGAEEIAKPHQPEDELQHIDRKALLAFARYLGLQLTDEMDRQEIIDRIRRNYP